METINAHVLDDNWKITNTIVVKSLDFPGLRLVDASIGGNSGDRIVNGAVVPKQAPEPTAAEHNAPILAALEALDAKSIRPLREGDTARVASLEQQAAALRLTLRKD